MQNLKFIPQTGDYDTVQGSPVPSDSILDKAYIALKIPQTKYLYGGTTQGSLLWTLERLKRSSSIDQQFASLAKAAIQAQLIDTKQATGQAVTNLQATRTGTSNLIEIVPAATQLSNEFNFNSV